MAAGVQTFQNHFSAEADRLYLLRFHPEGFQSDTFLITNGGIWKNPNVCCLNYSIVSITSLGENGSQRNPLLRPD